MYDAAEEQAAKMVLKATSALSAGSSVQLVFMAFIVWNVQLEHSRMRQARQLSSAESVHLCLVVLNIRMFVVVPQSRRVLINAPLRSTGCLIATRYWRT